MNGACPLEDEDAEGGLSDSLESWKNNMVKYNLVAHLARLHLVIPATSAPSERIWSRAARILTLKRASFKEDLVARMIFVRGNISHLRKNYMDLEKAEREVDLHDLMQYELEYLPPLEEDEDENKIDAGQDDHLFDFDVV